MTYELEKEMNGMCNLSDYVERCGIEQGIEQGIEILVNACREFGASREETVKKVEDKYNLTSEAAVLKVNAYWNESI